MDDLISRQAAIEYFMTNTNWHDEDGYPIEDAEEKRKLLEDYFNGISSAEPSCSEIPNSSDAVSRQAAIDAAESAYVRNMFPTPLIREIPPVEPGQQWIPVSERLPSKEERKEWIDNNLDGIGYLYPCLVTRYSSINPDRTKNNPYVAKHYFDGEDFLNAGEEVCSEYIIAWMPLPKPFEGGIK